MNYPNRIIKKGEADADVVRAIQQQLSRRGITNVEADGVFGDETAGAVKLFQTLYRDSHNIPLETDGIVGSLTWESLFNILFKPNAATETNLLREALSAAQSQVGVMENPLGSNRGREVEQYQASVDMEPGNFWCAAFIYFCFDKAVSNIGIENPLVKTGGCLHHWINSKAEKIKAKDARDNPSLVKPGNIFIIDHGGGHEHTGIVKRIEGGRLITIERNSNPNGSSNGIGVFELNICKVWTDNLRGYLNYA